MKDKLLYSQCWEDPIIVCDALKIEKSDNILSISSAGDNSLFLLSKCPKEVVSIDILPEQNFLLELKAAGIKKFEYEDFLKFIGAKDCPIRKKMYSGLRHELSQNSRKYWDNHIAFIESGIIHSGRFEKYLKLFKNVIVPISHTERDIEDFFSIKNMQMQEIFYSKIWNNLRWRITFRFFFSEFLMKLLGRNKEFFKYNKKKSVSEHYLQKTCYGFTKIPARTNYFLYYILKNSYAGNMLPEYLKEDIFLEIKKNIGKLRIITSDLKKYLENCLTNRFNKFNMSDVFEVYSQEDYEKILGEIQRVSRNNGRICYWNNLVDRFEHKNKKVLTLKKYSEELQKKDRIFFYKRFLVEKVSS